MLFQQFTDEFTARGRRGITASIDSPGEVFWVHPDTGRNFCAEKKLCMKKYLKEKHSTSVANKVKKANLMRMYNKCSDFLLHTQVDKKLCPSRHLAGGRI